MKLSEIEAVGRTKIFTGEFRLYKDMSELNEYIKEVDVYTADQMREYAKAQVAEALKACLQIKVPGRCDGKSAMIAEQFKNTIDSIFEEDTKND